MRKHMTRAFGLALALALPPLAVLVTEVDALAKVGNLRIDGDDIVVEDEIFILPPGTEELTVAFDYKGASRSTIAVRIEGMGGLRLYESSARYSGDGDADVVVRGAEVFAFVADAVETTSRELVSVVRDIANATSISSGEVFEHLTAIENLLRVVSGQLDILESARLDGAAAIAAQDTRSALDEIELSLEEAKSLPLDDIDGRKAEARLMMEPADELRAAASIVASAVGDLESAAFPESAGGWFYTVSARLTEGTNVQDAIADSVEFGIAEPGSSGASARPGDPTVESTTRPGGGSGGIGGRSGMPTTPAEATRAAEEDRNVKETEAAQNMAARPRATSTSEIEPGDPDTEDQSGSGAATSAAGAGEGRDLTGEASGGVGDEASALPTWTVPANRTGGTSAEQNSIVEPESEGGLNLGVLFLGILALVAIAYWLRQRM